MTFAAPATVILLGSNLLLRFAADKIQPPAHFEEEANAYKLFVTCQHDNEFDIRSSVINCLRKNTRLLLSHLESADCWVNWWR